MENSRSGFSQTNAAALDDETALPVRTFRVKCFKYGDRGFNGFVSALRALHEGFWLGFLRANDLNRITMEHFDQSQYFASTEHNLSGFFEWEKRVVDRYFKQDSRILVAAAGAGREVLALRKAGFAADGFECSLHLLRSSSKIFDELGESRYVIHCPPDRVPPGLPAYDGLVVGWTAYTHIPTRTRRVLFLQDLCRRAPAQSPLLISFFTRRSDSPYDRVTRRTANICRVLLRGHEELLELGDGLSFGRYVHSFTRDELEAELRMAGIQLAHYAGEGDWGHAVGITK